MCLTNIKLLLFCLLLARKKKKIVTPLTSLARWFSRSGKWILLYVKSSVCITAGARSFCLCISSIHSSPPSSLRFKHFFYFFSFYIFLVRKCTRQVSCFMVEPEKCDLPRRQVSTTAMMCYIYQIKNISFAWWDITAVIWGWNINRTEETETLRSTYEKFYMIIE